MKFWALCFFVFNTIASAVSSQRDSIPVQIDELAIINSRLLDLSGGTKIQHFDSVSLQQHEQSNLTELLSDESALYVKSYGAGSLASSSFRGGSASQTAVLWNGINMSSSMNGVLDFSLVPNLFFDDISIQYGGASTLWGSGGFGGAIHLNNELKFNTGTKVDFGASAGSFGTNTQKTKLVVGKKKYVFSLAAMRSSAENNFTFSQSFQGKDSLIQQVNASYLSTGLMAGFKCQTNENSILQLDFWYQKTDRKIPPTLTSSISNTAQNDAALRASTTWKYLKNKNKFQVKGAYFKEMIRYADSITEIVANNFADNLIVQADYTYNFTGGFELNAGALNTFILSETDNYKSTIQENRLALFTSLKFENKAKNLLGIVSGRQAIVNTDFVKPTVAFQVAYRFVPWLELKGKTSTVYRVPTLNDKYWNPGGNPFLKAEDGYSMEAGMVFSTETLKRKKTSSFSFDLISEVTLFSKNITNWIAWVPGANYWMPKNIKEVWSRGTESLTELKIRRNDLLVSIKFMTNYVLSTNEKADNLSDNSVGKQLIYVPRYTGFLKFTLMYKNAVVSYRHNYTGYVFTATDHSDYLTPFDVGGFYVSYKGVVKKQWIKGFFQINNMWNENYQRVSNRPMPLIAYTLGLNISLTKASKSNNNEL